MISIKWQAIHFVEGQTVAEFLEQFVCTGGLDRDRHIEWSALGGIFETALYNPSPRDGKSHVHLPIFSKAVPQVNAEETQFQLLDIFYRMLQQRSVTVNTQVLPTYPPVVNPLPNPFMPLTNGTGDTMFDTNKTTCNAKSSLV